MAEPYEIKIKVEKGNARGSMHYTWASLHARPDDKVFWSAEDPKDGPFTVLFKGRSPFVPSTPKVSVQRIVSSPDRKDGRLLTPTFTIRTDPDVYGTHYYAVAILSDGEVFVDADCPSVVIK